MEHLLNSRTLFLVFAAVAWLVQKINSSRKNAAAASRGRPPARDAHGGAIDPEAAERTRRVREEVARKIAQRRNILMMPSARLESPKPTLPPLAPRIAVEAAPPPLSPPPAMLPEAPLSPIYIPHLPDLVPSARPANVWLEQLRQPEGFRRAVILREILGPPVGLR